MTHNRLLVWISSSISTRQSMMGAEISRPSNVAYIDRLVNRRTPNHTSCLHPFRVSSIVVVQFTVRFQQVTPMGPPKVRPIFYWMVMPRPETSISIWLFLMVPIGALPESEQGYVSLDFLFNRTLTARCGCHLRVAHSLSAHTSPSSILNFFRFQLSFSCVGRVSGLQWCSRT